jgi:hypothetical protein
MSDTIEVSWDFVEQALDNRYDEVKGTWGKLEDADMDVLYDYLKECFRDSGAIDQTPMGIIDNFLVNGDYGYIEDYADEGETTEEFLDRRGDELMNHFEGADGREVIVFSL